MIAAIIVAAAVLVVVCVAGAIASAIAGKTGFGAGLLAFLRKSWTWLAGLAAAAIAVLVAVQVLRARLAEVAEAWYWKPVGGDQTRIDLWEKGGGKMHTVKLPLDADGKQIVAADIVAAGISEKGVITVEIKHIPTDRRAAPARE